MNTGIDNEEDSEVERLKLWLYCFGALDFALNSPESLTISDSIRSLLEELKTRLEVLMEYYEENTVNEIQWRA